MLYVLVGTRFQVLFHSPPGVLFTFPSQYYTLSVIGEYLGLEGGPPVFPPGFTCPAVLWILMADSSFRIRDSHTLWLNFPFHSTNSCQYRTQSEPQKYCSARFPHSEIHGSLPAFDFPWLIVDRYVLHRLPMPRHPPCALLSLTFSELCVLMFVNFSTRLYCSIFTHLTIVKSFEYLLHYLVVSISHYLYSVFKVHLQAFRLVWWAQEDSNLRPHAYQACALTT